MAQITGREPGDDLVAAVYRRAEGNPLFTEALVGNGESDSGLPESLHDLLMAGLRRLPEETQEVVRVASAGGERIGHGLLTAVTGLDGTALGRALRPAVAANVLRAESDGYVFRHALIREAVHDELLPGERGQVHSRFAEVIAADPALVTPGRAPGEQARHWHAAHDMPRALVSAWQAAGQAGRALAYAEQLAMLSRVLELWEQVPDAARADRRRSRRGARGGDQGRRAGRGGRPGNLAGQGRAAGGRRRRGAGPGRAPAPDPRPAEVPPRPDGLRRGPARRRSAWSRPTRRARRGPGCSKRWPTSP